MAEKRPASKNSAKTQAPQRSYSYVDIEFWVYYKLNNSYWTDYIVYSDYKDEYEADSGRPSILDGFVA